MKSRNYHAQFDAEYAVFGNCDASHADIGDNHAQEIQFNARFDADYADFGNFDALKADFGDNYAQEIQFKYAINLNKPVAEQLISRRKK